MRKPPQRSNTRLPKQRTGFQLGIEQLEPRLLMNADNNSISPVTSNVVAALDVASTPAVFQPLVGLVDVDDAGWSYERWQDLSEQAKDLKSEQAVRDWLIHAIDQRYADLFGTATTRPWRTIQFFEFDTNALFVSNAASSNVGIASDSYSETNVQVEGVDEADLIETDGEYLYLISGKQLLIVDATDPDELSIASRIQLEEQPVGMYLSGDRLTLLSSGSSDREPSTGGINLLTIDVGYGYGSTSRESTVVTVLDITDRSQPSLVERTKLQGQVVSSRMVGGQLRLVLQQDRIHLPTPESHLSSESTEDGGNYVYESRDAYLERVLEDTIDSLLSTARSYSVDGQLLEKSQLVRPEELNGYSLREGGHRTIIATFDVLDDEIGPADSQTLFSTNATTVYSSRDSIYLAGNSGRYYSQATTIWKFDLDSDDHSIELSAKGEIAGTLLNQFSLDEHEGYLRVVVSEPGWSSGHSLHVLKQVGDGLEIVGSVENLAPGERLHSVRFLGERAFFVTFQKVDPLFAIDLSNPESPELAGELKIPGYSDYLQPIGENHLLGLGRGADESIGLFQELQVSIFDVTDLDDPLLAHRYSFEGGRNTASIATGGRWSQGDGDHHAVSYFPSEEILAIPIYSADQHTSSWANVDNRPIFAAGTGGLQVFSVSTENGFEPLTMIEHDSPILRSLRIGESLLVFSAGEITSHELADPSNQLDSLSLLVGTDVGVVELSDYLTIPTNVDLQALAIQAALGANLNVPLASALEPQDWSGPDSFQTSQTASPLPHLSVSHLQATDSVFTSSGESETAEAHFTLRDSLLDDVLTAHA
ncbi:beta-propeller domain-containing protein [Adhaeretor mobilis]|uniref:Beta propeller domain protein n=1 Tax=Adhaeretor mobilis TaxID=1930276 RepID=A0A517MRE0_9BACT|nr:beta-propeller domain-containing protein [Adhaeretor mobilis]QDS97450.1 Beta propeller domain protein [Adhaeretor mobilis]